MNLSPLQIRLILLAAAALAIAIGAAAIVSPDQDAKQDFRAAEAGSGAYQTITASSDGVWDVQLEVMYSDAQRQAYQGKVARRVVSIGASQDSWQPLQHLPLTLTVSNLDGAQPQVVLQENIESEPLVASGDHAGFLALAQIHLQPGKYRVAIRTSKGDAVLGEFGTRLLVTRRWN